MLIPKPEGDEKKFMGRCMGDENMQEYDNEQRAAICHKSFKTNGKAEIRTNQSYECIFKLNTSFRYEKLNGDAQIVVPVVLLKEGVHNHVFYPAQELEKFPESWNGRPVPVFHPGEEGEAISANDPKLIEANNIGSLFGVVYDNETKALKGEVWISIAKAAKVFPYILTLIYQKKPIEVSTGLWGDMVAETGKWNEEEYSSVLINYRPDHLALLPGKEGACSWKDGCGIRSNVSETLNKIQKKLDKVYAEQVERGEGNKTNAQEKNNINFQDNSRGGKKMVSEKRVKEVSVILSNSKMPFKAEHKEWLEGLPDEDFSNMLTLNERLNTCKECNGQQEAPKPVSRTVEEFIANAPEGMREVLETSLRMHAAKKNGYVKAIMANKRNKFAEAVLKAKSMEELGGIYALIEEDTDYSAKGGGTFTTNSPDENGRYSDGRGVPKVATMTWGR